MRYFKKNEVVLSEDPASQPKDIRFKKTDEITDLTTLVDGGGDSKTFPLGVHVIDMGNVAEGRWFYLIADKEMTFTFGGGSAITVIPNKPTEMWVKFSSLSIEVFDTTRVTVAIAGE